MRHVSRLPGTSTEFSWDIENSLHLHRSGKVAQVFKEFSAAFSHFPRACGRANKHAALHTCTDACRRTRRAAPIHGPLQINTALCTNAPGSCICAEPRVHVHEPDFINTSCFQRSTSLKAMLLVSSRQRRVRAAVGCRSIWMTNDD